jgi:hypothetical protein
MPRDDFSKRTIEILADRAGNRCSNPACRQPTSGPRTEPDKAVNIGVAAHITAASERGPRFDPSLAPEERRHPDNGLWLCQNCAKLVDNDPAAYPVEVLRVWKRDAEEAARRKIEQKAANVDHPGALAQGRASRSASGRAVVGSEIHGPVVTGEGSIAAGGDVVFAGESSRVQIGSSIHANEIHAENVISGVQFVGTPSQATIEDLQQQSAALQNQLAAAIDVGVLSDPADAVDARNALAAAQAELDKPEPNGWRVVRKLAEVTEILAGAAEVTEAMAGAGTQLVKLAAMANALWKLASKRFGG